MMTSQILKFADFRKTQKSRYLENETFFLQTKKINLSVIRQKGESQNGFFKKTKHAKFAKTNKNVRFSENLACFVLKHRF